jgi:glycosyltransferase involved in cell wall biosynthesis
MRILYHHRTAARDGMSVHIEELIAALRGEGHEVLVVGPANEEAQSSGRTEALVGALRRSLPRPLVELLELAYNLPCYRRLSKACRSFKPDIIYERYNLFLVAGLWLKRRHKLPLLLEVNSPLARERAAHSGLSLAGLARACETAMWRHADAVLPVTGVLAEDIIRARGSRQGVHVIPNGVDLARFGASPERAAMRRKLGLDDGIVLGFVGFIREWHGLEWAIDALTQLPANVHLLVVGDGPARAQLEIRAQQSGVGARTHFVGRIPHGDMPAYVGAFDVALQPRSVEYASPLKLFEYMALGLPVVAPDQPNIREVTQADISALLFAPGDPKQFTAALQRLCADAGLRTRLGKGARSAIETVPLTWRNNARRIGEIARGLRAQSPAAQAPLVSSAAA